MQNGDYKKKISPSMDKYQGEDDEDYQGDYKGKKGTGKSSISRPAADAEAAIRGCSHDEIFATSL